MPDLAERLSARFPFAGRDRYATNSQARVGERANCPRRALQVRGPESAQYDLGRRFREEIPGAPGR